MRTIEGKAIDHGVINPVTATGVAAADLTDGDNAANAAYFTAENQPARYMFDGANPTATTGHVLAVGDSVLVKGKANISAIKFIDTAAGASTVRYTTLAL